MYAIYERRGFTLLELLVVVTIIVVLLALLVPALDKAIFETQHSKCLANLRTIGQGQSMYLQDNGQTYPPITTWNTLIGKNGSAGWYGEHNPHNSKFGSFPHHPRLLNMYLGYSDPKGEVPIAECPLDEGDSEPDHTGAKENCYQQYGTSYLPAFGGNWFRVRYVYGVIDPNSPSGVHPGFPTVKHSLLTGRTQNKMLVGDWPWHANRKWEFEKTRWHGYTGTNPGTHDPDAYRQLNFLFADGHVELFDQIQVHEVEHPYVEAQDPPPDRGWKWW